MPRSKHYENIHNAFMWRLAYAKGLRPSRYPVPALFIEAGYCPSGMGAMRGVPYIFVTSFKRCWTFWEHIGLVEEWYDTDGLHRLRRYVNHSVRGE